MLQNPNPRTSLLRGVGPTLTTNWLARGWKLSASMRKFILNGFGIFLSLIVLSLWTKSMGGAWALVPWAIGGGLLIGAIAAGLAFPLAASLPAGLLGFIRHQAGGTPGLSAEDGIEGGWNYVEGLWKGFRDILFWTPLVFFGIGFFRVEDNLAGVIPFLGVSLALIIHYAGTRGTFFRNLVVLVYTLIAIWVPVITWFPAAAERQAQFLSWWELNMSRNGADRASDAQNADQHAKNVLAANACFAELKKIAQPTQEDKDRCEALRKSVGTYVYRNAAEQQRAEANARLRQARVNAAAVCWKGINEKSKPEAVAECEGLERDVDRHANRSSAERARIEASTTVRNARVTAAADCWKGITPKSEQEAIAKCEGLDKEIDQPLVAATPPAPPPPQGTTGAGGTTATTTMASSEGPWTCDKTYREFEFNPRLKAGRVDLEPLPPGKYEITVTGKRQQPFYVMNSAGKPEHAATCQSDPEGNLERCTDPRGTPIDWKADPAKLAHFPGEGKLPDPSRAHGTVMAHVWGHIIPVGSAVRIGTAEKRPIALDLNADRYPLNWSGTGAFAVKITQCEATRT